MPRVKSNNNEKNTVETALAAIREGILEGRFVPGQRLVEIDLMNELGVSRGNIREVFRILETESIVLIEKNRGASVRKISKQEIQDTFEVLETISTLAVEKVAKRSKDPEIRKELEKSLKITKKFDTEIDQHAMVKDYMEENTRFWGCIGELSGNAILQETKNRLQLPLFRLQLQGIVVRSHKNEWVTHHQDMLVAILEGDIRKARKLAIKAQQDVLHAMLSLPDSAYL